MKTFFKVRYWALFKAILLLLFSLSVLLPGCGGGGGGHASNPSSPSTKSITSFSLNGYFGIINETSKTIVVTMPTGTTLTNLVATFTTTGIFLLIDGVGQVSGITPNDFTSPVVYTVIAADNTTKDYTVTITLKVSEYSMSGNVYDTFNSGLSIGGDSPGSVVYNTIEGAIVAIADKTATTDSAGDFSLSGIPTGTYVLSVSRHGYDTYSDAAYYVSSNKKGIKFYLDLTSPLGMLALDKSTGAAGISWNKSTINLAEKGALEQCGSSCTMALGFGEGMCAAYASGDDGWGYAMGDTSLIAESAAIASCSKSTTGCVLKLSQCNKSE